MTEAREKFVWTSDRAALLGVETDAEVAARFGLTAPQIISARCHRGIRPVKDCTACGGRFTVRSSERHCPRCRPEARRSISLAAQKRWSGRNRDEERHRFVQKKYGLTAADVAALVEKQTGLCPICDRPLGEGKEGRNIDHVHGSDPPIVRGIVHGRCNRALGLLHDDPAAFRRAAAYLEASGDGRDLPPVPNRYMVADVHPSITHRLGARPCSNGCTPFAVGADSETQA